MKELAIEQANGHGRELAIQALALCREVDYMLTNHTLPDSVVSGIRNQMDVVKDYARRIKGG